MSISNKVDNRPWYKHAMVWFVIALPATAVVAGLTTVYIAASTQDGLVVDDYYKKGLEINRELDRDHKASELGLSALVDTNAQTGEVLVTLTAKEGYQATPELTYKLIHRTLSGADQTTTLNEVGDSLEYRGYIKPPVIEGRWTIQIIADTSWRLKQNFTSKNAPHILLNITSSK
jgi:uncharacterized protein